MIAKRLAVVSLMMGLAAPLCAQNAAPAADAPEETIPVVPAAPVAPVAPNEQQQKIARDMADNMARMMSLTPEQVAQEFLKIKQQLVRTSLGRAGYETPEVQNDVLQFLNEQEQARVAVRRAAAQIYQSIEPKGARPQGEPVGQNQMFGLVNDYLAAVQEEKARHAQAEIALDARIHFSDDPKLRAVLLLNGYIGEAGWFTGDTFMGASIIGSLTPFIHPNKAATR